MFKTLKFHRPLIKSISQSGFKFKYYNSPFLISQYLPLTSFLRNVFEPQWKTLSFQRKLQNTNLHLKS